MEDNRLVFSNIMENLLKQAKKNKNVLEYKEINDAFKDIALTPEKFEWILDYFEKQGVDVLNTNEDDTDDDEFLDDNEEIAKMVEALSAFFRYSISRKGNLVTLRDELANIENYMLIQRYRFNNRFSMEVLIDEEDEEAFDFLIPRLIIQPVVENAIFHGLEEKLEGGKVTIDIIVTDKNLILMISDNGKGMDVNTLKELNARIQSNNVELDDREERNQRNTGIALPNIHKRIQLLFGEEYGVNVYSTAGQGTDVEITIPANYKTDREKDHEERIVEN